MRIGIDVRYLSHGLMGGVRNYVAYFVSALIDLAPNHRIFLYADTKSRFELQNLPAHATVRYLAYRNGISSIYNDFYMRRQMARDGLDIAHFPANYGFGPATARTIVTVHDAINLHKMAQIIEGLGYSNSKTPRNIALMAYLHYCTTRAVHQADLILTISEYSRREIATYGKLAPQAIISIPHGVPPDVKPVRDETQLADVRRRHGLIKPFIMADALKNPGVIIRAWALLPEDLRQHFQIIFFCRRPDPLPIIEEAVLAGHARLLVRPSWPDLMAMYSMANAFVFPSWIEGFGMPVLEAMTCGAPVIASDRGSIPEVAGNAALLMDAEDEKTLAQHLIRVLGNPAEAELLRQLGYAWSAKFTWPNTAQRILDSYEQVLSPSLSARSANAELGTHPA